jgi:hypothetical protein
MRPSFIPAFLGLVPVTRSSDISAVIGWAEAASDLLADEEVSVVLRSWEQRFGAQVMALTAQASSTNANHRSEPRSHLTARRR